MTTLVDSTWPFAELATLTPRGRKNTIVDGPFGSNLKTEHYRKSGIPIITSGFVTTGEFQANSYLYVDQKKFEQEKRSAVYPRDIVMAKIGARCGASATLPPTHRIGILSGNALKISIDESRHSTDFVSTVLRWMYERGDLHVLRSTGAQPAISMPLLKRLMVPAPQREVQVRIAGVIADVDKHISMVKQMILKKEGIKLGVMQHLLLGRSRLPGVSGKWMSRRLSDLLAYEQPGRYLVKTSKQLESGRVPVLTAGKTFIRGYTNERQGVYTQVPVIIFDDFTTASKYVDFDFKAKSSAMKILSARPDADLRFIYERMQLIDFPLGDHKRHWISEYSKLEILVPDVLEQTAIAEVISDIDLELLCLRDRLGKADAMMQGVVQELLTGRTRLSNGGGTS